MTDAELDGILGTWFQEGPETAPDRIAERAMLEVATTPQESGRLTAVWASMAQSPLAWAAVILAFAIGLGVIAGPLLVGGEPSPTPSPSQSPSPGPDALVPYISEESGYQLLVPANWLEVDSDYPDARKWVGPDGELMVSYGASIFDGGAVTTCAPPLPDYNTCMPIENGYSVPFNPEVDGVGPISQELWLDRCDGGCPVTATETTLDQETASQDRAVISDLQLTYVSTFHDRRPIVLYWAEPVATADEDRVDAMRASFRFLEPAPGSSQEPFVDPTELITYTNVEDRYELLVPRFWLESAAPLLDPNGVPYPGVQAFGNGAGFGSRNAPALTISMGTPAGSVNANCIHDSLEEYFTAEIVCQALTASTLEALDEALISIPPEFASVPDGPVEEDGDFVLGGEAGQFERPTYTGTSYNCLGCPGMLHHLYALHNGRPAVLAFDFWTVYFEEITAEYFTEISESFRFLD